MAKLVIVGLGPGDPGLISTAVWDELRQASPLLLRTEEHFAVQALRDAGLSFASYDHVYEKKDSFAEVYEEIAKDVIAKAAGAARPVYAVPGSPVVAERTVAIIRSAAAAAGLDIKLLPGVSFLDVAYDRLGIDPVDGLAVIDAFDIGRLASPSAVGMVVSQVYSRQVASELKLSLAKLYGDEYEIVVLHRLTLPGETVRRIPLYELDRLTDIDHLTTVYVPPRLSGNAGLPLGPLVDVMARLRSPGGCPWDIEQTHASLRRYMIEEVYEVLEAVEMADDACLCEELGDLLLQIVFHAQIAAERGAFSIADVVERVAGKLVHRHPHVFGDVIVRSADDVVVNWEKIKAREKKGLRPSVLDGVPRGLPSLMRAFKLQTKAAKVGFDWDSPAPVWDKVAEELGELRRAVQSGAKDAIESEMGDLLFAIVNLARFLGVEPEVALTAANNKFLRRFRYVEEAVQRSGKPWNAFSLQELDAFWEEAKAAEARTDRRSRSHLT